MYNDSKKRYDYVVLLTLQFRKTDWRVNHKTDGGTGNKKFDPEKKCYSYKESTTSSEPNILNRKFHSDKQQEQLVTERFLLMQLIHTHIIS